MTSPRREKWLFDRDEFLQKVQLFQSGFKGQDSVFEFIQSEIKRNVREFAERIKQKKEFLIQIIEPEQSFGLQMEIQAQNRLSIAIKKEIDALLKELE